MHLIDYLEINNFKNNGSVVINENLLDFNFDGTQIFNNITYVWVATKSNMKPIALYIGKSSFDIVKRSREHKQGFQGKWNNGSASGELKKEILMYLLQSDFKIAIYVKAATQISSDLLKVLKININKIPLPTNLYTHHMEEEIFIQLIGSFNSTNQKLPLNHVNVRSVSNAKNFIQKYFEPD